jgi:hypothetical protein
MTEQIHAISQIIKFDLEKNPELLEILELTSAVTGLPVSAISFLDDEFTYLKVRKGVEVPIFPRQLSFCTYAIQQDELMVVEDALLDERFAANPLVTDGPKLRFYAGMPLKLNNGVKIGTLCVLDSKSNQLDSHQQLVIKILSNQVVKILELQVGLEALGRKQKQLEEQIARNNDADIRLRSFFESSTNFQVLLGKHAEVIDFNKTAYNFIRAVHKAKLQRGDQFIKYLAPDFVATFIDQYNLALEGTKSFKEGSTDYDEMGVIWWEAAFEAARDNENNIIGVSYLIRNVTERKLKEQKILSQNASLIKIAHIQAHEFRAPLTSIMGLMNLIKDEDYEAPREYLELLDRAVNSLDDKIRQIVTDIDASFVSITN